MVEFAQNLTPLAGRYALQRFGTRRHEDAEGADRPVAVCLSEVVRDQQKARLAEGVFQGDRAKHADGQCRERGVDAIGDVSVQHLHDEQR